jgi:hypothetical protein
MPWFSRKKKRKQKNAAVNSASKDDAVVTTTSQPAFAVVVQNFESSVSDHISVERGQVVEALFTKDDWVYVQDVNGRCGYVPGNFCFPLEKLRMGLPEESGERVRQLRAHPRPTTIHVDTFDDDPREGEVGDVREGEDEEVNSPDSGISCSHQASSSNMESVHSSLHNTRERFVTGNSSRRVAGDTGAESDRSHTHPIRHPERHKRFLMPNSTLPLLETALSAGEPDHSPSPPPLQPVNLSQTPGHAHHAATATVTDGDNLQSVSDGDDVFLPEANKPLGIYQCAETYTPQFEGEIPLQRDEVVVVLEAGSGEWVWAMGSEGKEGLVLKSLLHKYRPDAPEENEEEEDEIDIGEEVVAPGEEEGVVESEEAAVVDSEILTSSSATQTELIIDGVVREVTSSVPQRSSGTTASPPAQDTASVSIQTEFTLPNWFKNNTPVPTPNNTLTRSSTTGTHDDSHTAASSHAAAPGTSSSPPPQCHNSHTQHSNASSQPHPSSPHESSAPLKLLCNPHSSHSSSNSSGVTARASVENHPNTSVGVRTPRGPRVPLIPVSTPPRPSVVLQTPSANNATRTLVSSHDAAAAPAIARTGDDSATFQPQSTRPTSEPPQPQQHAVREPGTSNGQARQSSRVVPPSNGTGTIQRHRHALLQHTRIVNSIPFEPDNEAAATSHPSSSARCRRMQPTPVATAVRDYSPPQRARNALVLRRGDIMYAQPHVPFPHGWVWVYHTLHKTFGYVPKDHIAYMYLVQKDHGTVEDVV